ncbi:hypothetical protein Ancab_024865 [Ancistrocladus abbreviatus]
MKLSIPLCISILFLSLLQRPVAAVQKSYIVHLRSSKNGRRLAADTSVHMRSPQEIISHYLNRQAKDGDAFLYSYTKVINGFAAVLHEEEAKEMEKHPRVMSIHECQKRKLQTTRSWQFLGLEGRGGVIADDSMWRKADFGEDIIIANIDTGVWSEAASFKDEGYGPIPKKWRGSCANENDPTFHCNRKLIGAQYFYKGFENEMARQSITVNYTKSPRDVEGHGTHTLATAGGNFVAGVNYNGFANGTAKGGAPRARVAAYKACWMQPEVDQQSEPFCYDADILAAMEAAIHDQVDILSVSIGAQTASDYYNDVVAVGSFRAVKNGIAVIVAGGNDGPMLGSVSNAAPWTLTVAASTMDRGFMSYILLGNKKKIYKTPSLTKAALPEKKFFPVITGAEAAKADNATAGYYCQRESIKPGTVNGKILVCQRGAAYTEKMHVEAVRGGAVGMIMVNDEEHGSDVDPRNFPIPTAQISYRSGQDLYSYMNSTGSPVVYFTPGMTVVGVKPAPIMAIFSSRGPNGFSEDILKPDVTAPGVSILAPTSQADGYIPYDIMPGTSMACPHVAGVAALLKKIYPHWSPSAIKSAIMTTATTLDNTNRPILDHNLRPATPFAYGAGHIRPNSAMDPGLVYDMNDVDYLNFLCALGYSSTQIKTLSQFSYDCPGSASMADFNYPSISIPQFSGNATVTRRLKNVGTPATYTVQVSAPAAVLITVEPERLTFDREGQELQYKVIFKAKAGILPPDYVFGSLVWSDGKHQVRSSIVVSGRNSPFRD